MNNLHNNLNKILDIESPGKELAIIDGEATDVIPAPIENDLDSDTQEDYKISRGTFNNLIEMGNTAIEDLGEIARESEHPRAFEVMAKMMDSVRESAKELMELQAKKKNLLGSDNKKVMPQTGVTVERAVFVGTMAELQERRRTPKE